MKTNAFIPAGSAVFVFSIMILLMLPLITVSVSAAENEIYFNPQNSSARFCKNATVEIWVNATEFGGGQINLTYNPTCANVTNWVRNTTNFLIGGWLHYNSREWITFSTMDPQPSLLTGKYMVGTLTIHCVNESEEGCETPLTFIEPSTLFNDAGIPVPATWADGTFNCTKPAEKADLVITEKWVCWPDNCTICYNLTNAGNGTAAPGHNTTLYVDEVETAQDKVPVELAPGESYVGCFESYTWAYTPPDDNITVCADKNETVTESDEGNNCLTNTWKCGDVDGNGYITMADVGLLWPHVFHPAEYPIINEWTGDVDGNGYITMADVGLLWPHKYYPDIYPLNCRCS